jgi:hypothetical protein
MQTFLIFLSEHKINLSHLPFQYVFFLSNQGLNTPATVGVSATPTHEHDKEKKKKRQSFILSWASLLLEILSWASVHLRAMSGPGPIGLYYVNKRSDSKHTHKVAMPVPGCLDGRARPDARTTCPSPLIFSCPVAVPACSVDSPHTCSPSCLSRFKVILPWHARAPRPCHASNCRPQRAPSAGHRYASRFVHRPQLATPHSPTSMSCHHHSLHP